MTHPGSQIIAGITCAGSGITGCGLGGEGAGSGAGASDCEMKRKKRDKRGIAIRVLTGASRVKKPGDR